MNTTENVLRTSRAAQLDAQVLKHMPSPTLKRLCALLQVFMISTKK